MSISDDDTWTTTFDPTEVYGALGTGTYTLYAASDVDIFGDVTTFKSDCAYASVSVSMKQPSLSATADSDTVTQGDILTVTGTAELPKENNGILYYIFGENYFSTNSASVTGTSYVVNIDTTNFANGQYFVVVQHPMYDRLFNIGPVPAENGGYDIRMNNTGDYASGYTNFLFNTDVRQSANAAEALCQALDTQNIDDSYVCISFIVDSTQGNLLTIIKGARSSSYTYGDTLKLSGLNTNSDYVHIYMESPKGDREQLSISPIFVSDKTWIWTCSSFTYAKIPELGTYTFYAVAGDTTPPDPSTIADHLYAVWTMDVSLTMNQIIDAPGLENITIVGNTTGTPQICYYLFGENYYFETGYANINIDGSYRIDINKLSHNAGQYTLVLQHPGEDDVFNVYPEYVPERNSYDIKIRDNANDDSLDYLYWTDARTGKNAADALCIGIDTLNIDDQYLRIPLVVDPTEGSLISITNSRWSHSFPYGDTLTLSGVNTNSSYVHLYFECPNGTRQLLSNHPIPVSTDKVWTTSFAFPETPDLGTYTIYAVAGGTTPPDPFAITDYLYAAWTKDVCLTVDEPSLIITSGTSQLITGNATGTTQLLYYIFGTNYFRTDMISVDDDGSYWAYFNTETIAPGQYFAVIQHPGTDSVFNVGPVAADNWGYYIKMNPNGDYTSEGAWLLFHTAERQSANAAEALCQALDYQNIDDEYAKVIFIVTGQMISLNKVSNVVQGQPLNVSGTTNLQAGTIITVDVCSTAFTFISGDKSTIPSSSYITQSTNVVAGENGVNTWNITFDTSGLDIDTYLLTVSSVDHTISTIITVHKIIATPTPTPTQTAPSPFPVAITPEIILYSLTVDPEYSPVVAEGTPISVQARLILNKDSISPSESLRFSTDLNQSISWTIDVYKGMIIHIQPSEEELITSLNSTSYAYNISGLDLDNTDTVTVVINLTGLYSAASSNITALKIDGPDCTYSYLYGPTHHAPSFDDELELLAGWNFISVPKTLNASKNTAGSLFGSVETNNKNILAYNAQTRTWISILNQNEIIQPLNGYWIYSANQTIITLTYPSDPASPSIKILYPGWNAIGLSSDEPASAKSALAGTSWRTLIPWNLADGSYDAAIVNGGSDANSPDRLMTLGNGCWVYVDTQSTMTGLTA